MEMIASSSTDESNTVFTTCAYCGVGCGVHATVNQEDRSVSIKGIDQHPANYGRLCSKGSALGHTIGLNERLLEPHINHQPTSWDDALNTVANGFKKIIEEHGPDSVAFYVSGQLLTEDYYAANKLMKGYIGSANIDTNSRLCMSSSVVGHKRAFGLDTVPGCYDDFEKAELITLVGSNTAWCHPVLFQRIKAYKEANRNVKVVVIDPRRTQTCDIADLHLPVNLGTDVWLFNGLLNHLHQHNKINHEYVEQHCDGLEAALKQAEKSSGDIQSISTILGVNPDDLTQFYNWFGNTEKSVTLYSQGVNQSSSGTDKVNSILNCHLATGRIGKEGMGPFSLTGQPNAMGGREVGGLANTLACHMDFNESNVDRVQRFWDAPNMARKNGYMAVDLFNAIESGKVKAVWIMATNPVVSLPNAEQVKRALKKCELVVVSDNIADTDTTRLAHVILPAAPWSEKDGTVTNSERRISRQRRLLPLAGNTKPDWWIISEVAKRMGFEQGFSYNHATDIFKEYAALSGFENSSDHKLRDFDISKLQNITQQEYDNLQPFQWPLNSENPNGKARFFAEGGFFTHNRKARILALPPQLPKNKVSYAYPLRLNTGRIRDQWHTMTRTGLAAQLNQHISEPFVEMHPMTATQLKLSDQQLVQVQSQWGHMIGRLTITDAVKPENVFAPMHWTGVLSKTGRINSAVNPEVDPYSGQPESKHTPIKVSAMPTQWHGFMLAKRPIPWPTIDYVVSSKGEQHTRYELAHSESLHNPIESLFNWLGFKNEQAVIDQALEPITYLDSNTGIYRLAIMNQQGGLEAVAMIGPDQHLPQRTWLAMQFSKDTLDNRARQALLSGFAPAGEDIGRIVCACFSVGENTIAKAAKGGCKTPAEIGNQLKAGTNCGSCVPEIKTIIAQTK